MSTSNYCPVTYNLATIVIKHLLRAYFYGAYKNADINVDYSKKQNDSIKYCCISGEEKGKWFVKKRMRLGRIELHRNNDLTINKIVIYGYGYPATFTLIVKELKLHFFPSVDINLEFIGDMPENEVLP